MTRPAEDTALIAQALAYACTPYSEVSGGDGVPRPGTRNQVVEVIVHDPGLRRDRG